MTGDFIVPNPSSEKVKDIFLTPKKKKDENGKKFCKQKPIPLNEFKEQVDIVLERYTILPKFQEWALEIRNKRNDTEVQE